MKEDRLIETLHPLERTVIPILKDNLTVQDIAKATNLQEVEVTRAIQWLENKQILTIKREDEDIISLDKNGKVYIQHGLPEKRFLQVLEHPLTIKEIQEKANLNKDEVSISLGLLKRKNAITIKEKIETTHEGKQLSSKIFPEETFLNNLPLQVSELSKNQHHIYNQLKKRKQLIKTDTRKIQTIKLTELGKKLQRKDIKKEFIGTLTPTIIKNKSWKTIPLRRYDIAINVPSISPAKRHFVNQALQYIKQIWLDMGFQEQQGKLCESAFWNFDALFVPQDHPARELQDTFFIKDPKYTTIPKNVVTKVKTTHEKGGSTGSTGWKAPWSEKLAQENIMVTHDTYLSAQVLANITQKDLPIKTFQIMKAFRNEAMDWKHLFEFYQIGGIVADPNTNFRHLLGYLKHFYRKMGFPDVRLRPAHFPYTEPSCEVEAFHPKKKQWVEFGGAGVFRPEVVKPLLGIDCPVIAWGLGLERVITDYYNMTNLRDIYKNDLKQIREMKLWIK